MMCLAPCTVVASEAGVTEAPRLTVPLPPM